MLVATTKAAARIFGLETDMFMIGKHPFMQFYYGPVNNGVKASPAMTAYEADAWLKGFSASNARLLNELM